MSASADTSDGGDSYSTHVREFRHLLLSKQDTTNKHEGARQYLKRLFKEIDENGDGTISDSELYDFMVSLEVPAHVAEILVQQIDINHDGKVTYSELAEFLWPRVESQREIGLVIEVVREALISTTGKKIISRALKNNTDKDDDALLQAFAHKTNAVLVRGRLIDVRQLKRALHNLMGTSLGELSDYEIDMLAHSMDANNDSVVSAREFKNWLFLQKGYFRADSGASSAAGSESFTYDDVYPDPTPEEVQEVARKADDRAAEQKKEEVEEFRRKEAAELTAREQKKEAEKLEAESAVNEQRIVAERIAAERIAIERAAAKKAEADRIAQQKAEEAKRVSAAHRAQETLVAAEKRAALEKRIKAEREVAERAAAAAAHSDIEMGLARDSTLHRRDTSKESSPLLEDRHERSKTPAVIADTESKSIRAPCVKYSGMAVCAVVTYSIFFALFRRFRS